MSDQHSTYSLQDLLQRWKPDELTSEQLAGYLLQHVILHDVRIAQLEKTSGRTHAGPPTGGGTMSSS